MKKGKWSKEEDTLIKNHIEKYGIGLSWQGLSNALGLGRCGRSCRSRWLNYLRPGLKHGNFTPAEDRIICEMYSKIGSCWSAIAAELPGRTDLAIKNYWNCTLKKRFPRAARSRRQNRRAGSSWSDAASSYHPLVVVYNEEESIGSATPDRALVLYDEQERIGIGIATPGLPLVVYNSERDSTTTTGPPPSSHASVDDKPGSASPPLVKAGAQPQPPLVKAGAQPQPPPLAAADASANKEQIAAAPIIGPARMKIEPLSPPPLGDEAFDIMGVGCVPMSPLPLGLMEADRPYMAFLPPVTNFDDIDTFLSFFDH